MLKVQAQELLFGSLFYFLCMRPPVVPTGSHRASPRATPTLGWFPVHPIPGTKGLCLFLYIQSYPHRVRLQASFLWTQHPGFLLHTSDNLLRISRWLDWQRISQTKQVCRYWNKSFCCILARKTKSKQENMTSIHNKKKAPIAWPKGMCISELLD